MAFLGGQDVLPGAAREGPGNTGEAASLWGGQGVSSGRPVIPGTPILFLSKCEK